jgi:hypothetical protein
MKRLFKIVGIVLLSLLVLLLLVFFLGTSRVDTTPYFEEAYYKNTMKRLDSARAAMTETSAPVFAGFSKVSITPRLSDEVDVATGSFKSVPLAGYGGRAGKSATGIHDSVFVMATALRIGEQTVVLVASDLLIMPPNVVDSVTAMLRSKGISREQVFYSATHTHSSVGAWGPGYVGEIFAGKEDHDIIRWLVQQTAKSIEIAIADLKPAKIATGTFPVAKYTRNRLIGKTGTKNNDFTYIVLEQVEGKKAILGSYSAHATVLSEENFEVSGDYPGYWARKMELSFDHAMFFAASVGSQGPTGDGTGFERAKNVGEALADSLTARLSGVELKDNINLSYLSLKMDIPTFKIRLTTKRDLVPALSKHLLPFSNNVYLQALKIGDLLWVTTPCDFSGEFALQLKNSLASYGYHANVTSFNGSYVGYIVPGRYFYLDEYEPRIMGWFGPNMGEYTFEMIRHLCRAMTGGDNI